MQIRVSTKSDPANQGFRRAALAEQADTSRAELRRDSVYILYLHNPDLMTDLDDALEGINDLYQQGFFEEFGLSNFPAWQIMQIYMKCKEKGFPLPQVYQGAYNALTRQVESEILPCCRMLGMRFNAYSPFAAGLLQQPWADGSLSELRGEERGRYYGSGSRLSTWVGAKDEDSLADALVRVDTACRDAVRSPTQRRLRWAQGSGAGVSGLHDRRGDRSVVVLSLGVCRGRRRHHGCRDLGPIAGEHRLRDGGGCGRAAALVGAGGPGRRMGRADRAARVPWNGLDASGPAVSACSALDKCIGCCCSGAQAFI